MNEIKENKKLNLDNSEKEKIQVNNKVISYPDQKNMTNKQDIQNQQNIPNQENQVNSNNQSNDINQNNAENEGNKNKSTVLQKLINLPTYHTKFIKSDYMLFNIFLLIINTARLLRTMSINFGGELIRFVAKCIDKIINKNKTDVVETRNKNNINEINNINKITLDKGKEKQVDEKKYEEKKELTNVLKDNSKNKEGSVNNTLQYMQSIDSKTNNISNTSIPSVQTYNTTKNSRNL